MRQVYPNQVVVKIYRPTNYLGRLWRKQVQRLSQTVDGFGQKVKKLTSLSGWKKRLLTGSLFILAAVACGLVLAYAHVLPEPTTHQSEIIKQAPQAAVVAPAVSGPSQTNPQFAGYPTWSQNFADPAYTRLDPQFWQILVGPAQNSNQEAQFYTDSAANLRIENGALRLIATRQDEPLGYKYASARIETQGKQSFLYGRIDITAKLPRGVGTWPAIWLLPANNTYANLSPSSDTLRYKNGGEIDIIEAVGFYPNVVYSVAHTLDDLTQRADGTGSNSQIFVTNNDTTYNLYSLLWTPDSLIFTVNNKPFFTYQRQIGANYTTWPFDQPFYLIANLALGGSWGGQDKAHFPGDGIDSSALPTSLDIQSIYYYPYIGNTNTAH